MMPHVPEQRRSRAFTLVEVLISVGIATLLVALIGTLYVSLIKARDRNLAIQEVEVQGQQVLTHMTQSLRNAGDVTTPAPGASSAALSFITATTSIASSYQLSAGTITYTQSTGTLPLTNQRVVITGLSFNNLSRKNERDSVRIQFTVSYIPTPGRESNSYSRTFYGTANVRDPL